MKASLRLTVSACALAVLAACGGGGNSDSGTQSSSTERGTLLQNPPFRITAQSAADFGAAIQRSNASLLQVTGAPRCGVAFHYMRYATVGGANEATEATGALMVPTGTDPACTGARPIVLYAHGTTTDKLYNIADVSNPNNPAYGEGVLIAAMYAAQGFIVVAPNYAGYDTSPLPYHPYLNADQQSKDMMDALKAARSALSNVGTSDSGKLFITGYSQGGHVAMATHRAMQGAGQTVTASAPMSGPYAMGQFGDAVFGGNVNLGSTIFTPLLTTSFQKAYGNLYSTPSDIYESAYASGIDTLLPSTQSLTQIFTTGKLPQTALFSSTPPAPSLASITPPTTPAALAPLFALGFGTNNLIKNSARLAYLTDVQANPRAPQNPLRQAFYRNDLLNFANARPVMLCGGNADPTVFFFNTQAYQGAFAQRGLPATQAAALLTVLDVDSAPTGANDPFAAAKVGFAQAKAATAAAAGSNPAAQANAVVQAYHGGLVPPFCNAAVRGFFQNVLASGQ